MWKAMIKDHAVISLCDCFHVDVKRAYSKTERMVFVANNGL